MNIRIPVGLGELYDKLSVLEIKSEKIQDEEKLAYVKHEHAELSAAAQPYPIDRGLYAKLKEVNLRLWEVEDRIRIEESKKDFGEEFVRLARSVYVLNDERADLKRSINLASGSDIVEVKSYANRESAVS